MNTYDDILDMDEPIRPGITVLLIDDQKMIGEAVRRMLADEKDIVLHFCIDPKLAIQTAKNISPTVILQDLVMPDIDGLALVKMFRAEQATRDIPLIVLSSEEEAQTKADAFDLGANDYLVKLPDKLELIARIRYHSRSYLTMIERNEAFNTVVESQLALLESEERYRELVKHMSSGVLVLTPVGSDDDFFIVSINQAASKMEKITPESASARKLTDVLPRLKDSPLVAAIRHVYLTGESVQLTASYENNSLWHVNFVYRLASGEVVVVYDDISDYKRAEAELREAHNGLHAILSQVPLGIVITRPTGEIDWLNRTAMKMLKIDSEDKIIGQNFNRYISRGEKHLHSTDAENNHSSEGVLLTADNQPLPILESILKTTMNDRTVMFCAFVDVSTQKKTEQEKMLLLNQLQQEHKLEAIGELATDMVRDINAPIRNLSENLFFLNRALASISVILGGLDLLHCTPPEHPEAVQAKLDLLGQMITESNFDFVRDINPGKIKPGGSASREAGQ